MLLIGILFFPLHLGLSMEQVELILPDPIYSEGSAVVLTCNAPNAIAIHWYLNDVPINADDTRFIIPPIENLNFGLGILQFTASKNLNAAYIQCEGVFSGSTQLSNTVYMLIQEVLLLVSTEPITVPGTPTPVPTPTSTSEIYTSEGSTMDVAMKFSGVASTQTVEALTTAKQLGDRNGALIGGVIFVLVAVIGLVVLTVIVMILTRRNKRKMRNILQNRGQNGRLNEDHSQMETGTQTKECPVYFPFSAEKNDDQHYEYLKAKLKPLQDSLPSANDALSIPPEERCRVTQRGQIIGQSKVDRTVDQPRSSTSRQLKGNTDSCQAPHSSTENPEPHRQSSTACVDVAQNETEHTSATPENEGLSGAMMEEIGTRKYLVNFSSNAETDTIH